MLNYQRVNWLLQVSVVSGFKNQNPGEVGHRLRCSEVCQGFGCSAGAQLRCSFWVWLHNVETPVMFDGL